MCRKIVLSSLVVLCLSPSLFAHFMSAAAPISDSRFTQLFNEAEGRHHIGYGPYEKAIEERCGFGKKSVEYKEGLVDDAVEANVLTAEQGRRMKRLGMYPVVTYSKRDAPELMQFCHYGCFSPETHILTFKNELESEWTRADQVNFSTMIGQLKSSDLRFGVELGPVRISKIIADKKPQLNAMVEILLDNGNLLEVTSGHGMLKFDGTMTIASGLRSGDQMISTSGRPVGIKSTVHKESVVKVVNFRLDGNEVQDHILAAEGILIGDHAFQSDLEDSIFSINLRSRNR